MTDQCPRCLTGRTAPYGCATTDMDGDVTQRVVCSTCGFATWRVDGCETKVRDVRPVDR